MLVEQRRHHARRRAVEEGSQHVSQRGAARLIAAARGDVYVAESILLVREMALFLEDAKHGPHGRITRRLVHLLPHLGGGSLAVAKDDPHDLPLTAAEGVGFSYH